MSTRVLQVICRRRSGRRASELFRRWRSYATKSRMMQSWSNPPSHPQLQSPAFPSIRFFCPFQSPFYLSYAHIQRPLTPEPGSNIDIWNQELLSFPPGTSYLSGPWLFVECYMYRRIHNILSQTTHWRAYDVFKRQKDSTFRKSKRAICELAARYRGLVEECQRGLGSKEARKLLFV